MKRTNSPIFGLLLITTLLSPLTPVLATEDSIFNPNFILSDEEMQDWDSMNRSDIQAFLSQKQGYIARYRAEDVKGNKRLASDIIARAAKEYSINPKYILVKLQKEQSLITDPDPTQKQIDWATGYGVCDACSMNDPKIQKYKGFGNQVDSAAGIMRWYYDNVGSQSWIKRAHASYQIDNSLVIPANNATAFLYTYTPHLHGNENFWNLWQKWFEQVYPDATLVKTETDATVYLIQNSTRRPFSNLTALTSRFNPKLILTVPESEITRYELGSPISLPNFSILKFNSNYYLLDYDRLRPFESADTVKKLGYNPDEIISVTSEDIVGFTYGPTISSDTKAPMGELVRFKETKKLFFAEDKILHPIHEEKIATVNFPHLKPVTKSSSAYSDYTQGSPILFKDGTLLQIEGSPKVYVVEKGKLRHIASEEVFNGLGFNWKNILVVNNIIELLQPYGEAVYLREAPVASSPSKTPEATQTSSLPPSDASAGDKNSPKDYRDLMVKTSDADTTFIGPKFTTRVNTYVVAEYGTGKILAGKNVDTVRPMASFTKIMTAYRLVKEGLKPNGITTFDPKDHTAVYHTFRTVAGEKFYNHDLLDAFLLSSINTVGRMLVDTVESDEAAFIKRMNTQAKDWKLTNTKFVDVTGEDPGNVTTAREYLKLFMEASKNTTLKEVLGKSEYRYTEYLDLDNKPNHFDGHSNELVRKQNSAYTVLGSKTGYLYEAGAGLVQLVERKSDGKKFFLITMGDSEFSTRFAEMGRFADWTMKEF